MTDKFSGSNIIVTGGASGIGRGLAERFASLGAAHVVIADLDLDGANATAAELQSKGGSVSAQHCNVGDEASVKALVDQTIADHGGIDMFFANAGVGTGDGIDASDSLWELSWRVNVMGPVLAARHVVPHMEERGGGAFVITASAAGLTTGPTSFNYATSKHAVLGVAEWLAINHGPTIAVSAICPTIVATPMAAEFGEVLFEPMSVDVVVDATVKGVNDESFLILPAPAALEMFQAKANNYDGFLSNLQQMVQGLAK